MSYEWGAAARSLSGTLRVRTGDLRAAPPLRRGPSPGRVNLRRGERPEAKTEGRGLDGRL